MGPKIYVDIGNTLIKINYLVKQTSKYISYVTKKDWTSDYLYQIMPEDIKQIEPQSVYISSVVPQATTIIEKLFYKYWNISPKFITHESNIKISLDIEHEKQLGADLIALACYVNSKTNDGILINLGTATTIIHVKNKKLKGVIICPGLWSSFNSLIAGTTKLNTSNLKLTKAVLGTNTQQALSIGVLYGHSEMIKGLVSKIDSTAQIFISGGDAHKINSITKYKYVKEATIEGMKVIGEQSET